MIVKLLTEYHLEFLCLNGGCRGSSDSTYIKMPHCWKSHALAHICKYLYHGLLAFYLPLGRIALCIAKCVSLVKNCLNK